MPSRLAHAPVAEVRVRKAERGDIDALIDLEHRVFATDRLSRRSLRRFLQSPTAEVIVAEHGDGLAGTAIVLFRPRSLIARLYSISVAPHMSGRGIGPMLLAAAEAAAVARGCRAIRLEVHVSNHAAISRYRKSGYRAFGCIRGYYQDGGCALRFEKRLVPSLPVLAAAPPYFHQTTEFTCGPACITMALAWADRNFKPPPAFEFQLWREATTIFMSSGPGGCEPYGMAVALKRHGLEPEVHVSHAGPYFLDTAKSADKRRVMQVTQVAFQREAKALGIPTHLTPVSESVLMPTVETMLELREAKLYEHALPKLEDELNRCARRADFQPEGEFKLLVCFGIARDPRFESFGRMLFDWFRCPALEVNVESGAWLSIDRIRPRNITRLANGEASFLREALHQHTKREWRDPKARTVPKYDLAVLYDPNEKMAPSSPASIKHMARIAERLSVDVEPVTRRQLAEIAEYDGLFIRETTSIDNHTYRFARRAWQEGMPVIDDPISMIRCTNKVFLMELLGQNQVATPPTVMLTDVSDLPKAMDELGLPLVVKIPDGSFSRGVHKVDTPEEFRRIADELFEETDLLLTQKFLPTQFDWRVGVLAGEPLFVCQYRMARGHWQIVKHRPDGSSHEGGFRTFELDKAPPELIDIAVRAARPIEDQVGKDEIWTRLLKWFIERFEQ